MARSWERNQGKPAPLRGLLAEFRTALCSEIEAARNSPSAGAISLVNGRRIAQIAGSYQYVFQIESALNLPVDAPGELQVFGRPPLNVVLISVEGLTITLSVPLDLGPDVPSASLRTDVVFLLRKLIERIEKLASTPNPVGDRLLDKLHASGEPSPADLSGAHLNPDQAEAVASSLGRNMTFIWGPPGTGKTHTIGAIAEQLYRRGRSVLLVSHSNNGVDQALREVGVALDPRELAEGRVLRVGPPHDPRLTEYPDLLLEEHVERRSRELVERRNALNAQCESLVRNAIEVARKTEIYEWVSSAEQDLRAMTHELTVVKDLKKGLEEASEEKSRLEALTSFWAEAVGAAEETQESIRIMSEIEMKIHALERCLPAERDRLTGCERRLAEAESLYAETTRANRLVRLWRRLPEPAEQLQLVEALRAEVREASIGSEAAEAELTKAKGEHAELADKVEAFRRKYEADFVDVLLRADAYKKELAGFEALDAHLTEECEARERELEELLRDRLTVVREWGLTSESPSTAEEMLTAILRAYQRADSAIKGLTLGSLQAERAQLDERVRGLRTRIREIDELLARVREVLIAEATIVATTLTKAYLWEEIQARRFDTVILDEASMAPIPALWVAASLADNNGVVVGDFKQLPPIVISEHELARKWLGRDIFEVANRSDPDAPPSRLIRLLRQYRMHPNISAIPNALIYDSRLTDEAPSAKGEECLLTWYQHIWDGDYPVMLLDTGSLNAWVTSVPHGRRGSRLNFLSATICVDLAERFLRADRPKLTPGAQRRIFIVCPYRPHAKLLGLLLRERGLNEDVLAGTVHSFQGSEADVVIFDLVNDEPHWRVRMFMREFDEHIARLLNVAFTRARRRLVVVGDFSYMVKHAKNAFLGGVLIPFLKRNCKCVDALRFAGTDLAARSARVHKLVFGGDVEARASRQVVTQAGFWDMLWEDFGRAHSRIVIYSPFMTEDRLGEFGPHLLAAVERGVRVYVVTKVPSERRKDELFTYRALEEALIAAGVVVVHKRGMHEKLVFVDNDILWSGSLNPLSFRSSQEIMERRDSQEVVGDYARTLRLDDLICGYKGGTPKCPICGDEVVASEGRDKPFYWRCVQPECYTRDVDDPPLMDGLIRCRSCNGEVEYGQWGGEPAWRCLRNHHHHQRVARSHLRLPKMRAIVPKSKLRELDKRFGIGPSAIRERRGQLLLSDGFTEAGFGQSS